MFRAIVFKLPWVLTSAAGLGGRTCRTVRFLFRLNCPVFTKRRPTKVYASDRFTLVDLSAMRTSSNSNNPPSPHHQNLAILMDQIEPRITIGSLSYRGNDGSGPAPSSRSNSLVHPKDSRPRLDRRSGHHPSRQLLARRRCVGLHLSGRGFLRGAFRRPYITPPTQIGMWVHSHTFNLSGPLQHDSIRTTTEHPRILATDLTDYHGISMALWVS